MLAARRLDIAGVRSGLLLATHGGHDEQCHGETQNLSHLALPPYMISLSRPPVVTPAAAITRTSKPWGWGSFASRSMPTSS